MLNRLTTQISEMCRDSGSTFIEKWLLAPSRRTGYQWLDSVARTETSVFNFRVKSMRSMALELAASKLKDEDKSLVRAMQNELLLNELFGRLRQPGDSGYLLALPASSSLTNALGRAVSDLRLGGLTADQLKADDFSESGSSVQTAAKAREFISFLAEYEKELGRLNLVDYPGALRIAIENASSIENILVLAPADLLHRFSVLEQALWDALPCEKQVLHVDEPGCLSAGPETDIGLLGFINEPQKAGSPFDDGTVEVFRALGEVNEVKEVFRRCMKDGVALDDVEIICTDPKTYIPLIFELCSGLKSESREHLPVTFADGIPARYSKPARALVGWLDWTKDEACPQWILARMIEDGLLKLEGAKETGHGPSTLAKLFKSLPIYASQENYFAVIQASIEAEEKQIDAYELDSKDECETLELARENQRNNLEGLKLLEKLFKALLGHTQSEQHQPTQKQFLEKAITFLSDLSVDGQEYDGYCKKLLLDNAREMAGLLPDEDVDGLVIENWLRVQATESHVSGAGPRPGCAYVSSIRNGGHSGRSNTFIIGLDDTRFPGAGLEDPVLLDSERDSISTAKALDIKLITASARLTRDVREDFGGVLARIRGKLTLGYCSLDLLDDREMYPSRVLLSACRILSGDKAAGYSNIVKWAPLFDPASFAVSSEAASIDLNDWWLWMSAASGIVRGKEDITPHFLDLAQGSFAASQRQSTEFTVYDGYVPEAGRDFVAQPPVLSANALELLGNCPMDYFFKYLLGISAPDQFLVDPYRWLPYDATGSLLHGVFREFMSSLGPGVVPEYKTHSPIIKDILNKKIQSYLARYPNLTKPGIFEREVQDMAETVDEFLITMEQVCRTKQPVYFEAGIGMKGKGEDAVCLCPDPVEIVISKDLTIKARGCPDRIDIERVAGKEYYSIWDYKTGKSKKYVEADPLKKGRYVQSVLYMRLLKEVTDASGEGREISEFIYFFPKRSEHRVQVRVPASRLTEGMEIIGHLASMIADGCFPLSNNAGDLQYSDYIQAFGDVAAATPAVTKMKNDESNTKLKHFAALRPGTSGGKTATKGRGGGKSASK